MSDSAAGLILAGSRAQDLIESVVLPRMADSATGLILTGSRAQDLIASPDLSRMSDSAFHSVSAAMPSYRVEGMWRQGARER